MSVLVANAGFLWVSLLSSSITHKNAHLIHGVLVFVVILVLSFLYKASLKAVDDEVIPSEGVTVKNILQTITESVLTLIRSIIPHHAEAYVPLVCTIFIYVFTANMVGVIPGFAAPTGNFSSNLAIGVAVFVYYNYVGIKTAGFTHYMAHFFGPSLGPGLGMVIMRVCVLAPLMFGLEIFSHCVRPVTLALRLFVNINADHLVLGVFSGLVPLVVPVIFMAFGIFVAFMQAFVFALLSVIYIGMATQTQEHH